MSWRHFEDKRPKAAKDHRCCLCERPIPKGEPHVLRVGADDDGIIRSRMHIACELQTKRWQDWEWECHDSAEFREAMERDKAENHS